jgi:hypothetical protein
VKSPESNRRVFGNLWALECAASTGPRPSCRCFAPLYGPGEWSELELHTDEQDTSSPGWARLLELIDEAVDDHREVFSPVRDMTPEQWTQIVTLPPSIARLKSVKHFILYGSNLVRIPPEIGEMRYLEQFTPYTSYRLHWFPYEITRCKHLRMSTVSTRAIYGNYKLRPPFPRLPQPHHSNTPKTCSVCNSAFGDRVPLQYWVSLPVATDVLPLLVHACSEACLSRIPAPPKIYVPTPHQGGLGLVQPTTRSEYSWEDVVQGRI